MTFGLWCVLFECAMAAASFVGLFYVRSVLRWLYGFNFISATSLAWLIYFVEHSK